MNRTRQAVIAAYATAYGLAVWAGALALDASDALSAIGLFTASVGLLVGIHRECRHAARVIYLIGTYQHLQPADPDCDAAVEYATAVPPGCWCETWWTSLGTVHAKHCPIHRSAKEDIP
ncbi:hypothetical protein GCM10010387_16210 [Streptomyces inusitatus]|uniref:Uncharacterized protein n=1 Tax=Streptomyces inusitatus TaxID=68221 RepID=A0A918UP00_9ACTN|nr:hypothetical protein [Streptomyces inusitatus]GGZ23743.1 hypothetical protein GCM10010387_16210 [Streptomyces inusitatus]